MEREASCLVHYHLRILPYHRAGGPIAPSAHPVGVPTKCAKVLALAEEVPPKHPCHVKIAARAIAPG